MYLLSESSGGATESKYIVKFELLDKIQNLDYL